MSDAVKRILIAGALESPHFRRWCAQLRGMPFEFHLLATCSEEPSLREHYPDFIVHMYEPRFVRPLLPLGVLSRLRKLCGLQKTKRGNDTERIDYFQQTLEEVRPHVLHSHGLNVNWRNQMEGLHKARLASREAATSLWLYTSWGTDLDFYPIFFPEQDTAIRQIMPNVDLLVTECERDKRLAHAFGFRGHFWGKLPMFGGVEERLLRDDKKQTSTRRLFLIKGRDDQDEPGESDPVGRARFIFDALERERSALTGYEIVVLQATPRIAERVTALAESGMAISAPHFFTAYDDVLSLFLRAKAFFSMTVNDGLPSCLCEAMAAGALPVHSNLESVEEWITDGENGILTLPNDVGAIAAAIRRVILDDAFVDSAALLNNQIVQKHLQFDVIREQALQLYLDSLALGEVVRSAKNAG